MKHERTEEFPLLEHLTSIGVFRIAVLCKAENFFYSFISCFPLKVDIGWKEEDAEPFATDPKIVTFHAFQTTRVLVRTRE